MKLLELIFEAKSVGKLYHFTSEESLHLIKKCNCLKAFEKESKDPRIKKRNALAGINRDRQFISTTRNRNIHTYEDFHDLEWADALVGYGFPRELDGEIDGTGKLGDIVRLYRLTLDGDKLSNKYRIEPYQYSNMPDEYEERIFTDKIPNLSDYIISIDDVTGFFNKSYAQ